MTPSVSGASQNLRFGRLRGPEPRPDCKGENRECTEGKCDLAEHLCFSSPAWLPAGYLGLYRAPAASAKVASAAAVNSRCFKLFSFARIQHTSSVTFTQCRPPPAPGASAFVSELR